jgi:hypothetical protein
MLGRSRLVLSSCLTVLFIACAHTPQALNDDLTVREMREEFLRDNPDCEYKPYIARGEVVRGMNFLEVSASWGIPETRRQSKDRKQEYWTYFSADEVSGDWSRYTLTFQDKRLTDWYVVRHFAKNGQLTQTSTISDATATSTPNVSSSGLGSTRR